MTKKKPTIGIIGGKGKMGNWFHSFFKNQDLEVIISDKNTKLTNKQVAENSDIVIVSVPIGKSVNVIKNIRNELDEDALLTDLTSLKIDTCKEMKKGKCGALGMHPLFGPLTEDLKNQSIVFCPLKKNKWISFLKKIFKENGADIVELSPKEHDKQMAFIQALVHFTNIGLSHFLREKNFKPKPEFLVPTFKLQSLVLGRILNQKTDLYTDIELKNPRFKKLIKEYLEELIRLKDDVVEKNHENFSKKFNESKNHMSDFIKLAEQKSTEILKTLKRQPIRFGKAKKSKLDGKVAFLGPKGTFSWEASKKVFDKKKLEAYFSIKEVFEAVNNSKTDFGIVPIENTTTGLVSETMKCFVDYPVFTLGSFKIPINHYLLSKGNKLENIKTIKSHPQALDQCKDWINENMPDAKKEKESSTVSSIKNSLKKDVAFIAPKAASKLFDVNVLADKIENRKGNATRFLVITRKINRFNMKKLKMNKRNTLILLSVYDRVGILRDILDVFAKNKINLEALHSIHAYFRAWDYLFFLELETSYFSDKLEKTLKELEEFCPFIKVIGAS